MKIQNLEYKIYIMEDTYGIGYPEGYIPDVQTTDGISGLLAPS